MSGSFDATVFMPVAVNIDHPSLVFFSHPNFYFIKVLSLFYVKIFFQQPLFFDVTRHLSTCFQCDES